MLATRTRFIVCHSPALRQSWKEPRTVEVGGLIWVPKYRKRVLTGAVAERLRDVLRQISMEHEVHIISGKVSSDHVHMFLSYRPQLALSKLVQYLKAGSSRIMLQEFPRLRKQFWGRHLWARGYMAISSGNITDDIVQKYIDEQEGEPIDDNQFQIDPTL